MTETGYEEDGESPLKVQVIELAKNPTGMIRRRWIWMLLSMITLSVVTVWVWTKTEPTYQATSTVLVSSQQIPESFIRSTVRGLDSLSNVNALIGEVLSQRNLSDLIDRHDLYPKLSKGVARNDLVWHLRTNISIDQQRNINQRKPSESTAIFVISYEGESPDSAADVANDLASILIAANLEKRSAQARRTTEFLRSELNRAATRVAAASREITEFNQEHRGELPGDLAPLLKKLERLQAERQSINEQMSSAEDRLMQFETAGTTASSAEEQLLQIRLQLDQEMAIHTDEHPNVIALQRRIERMQGTVQARPAQEDNGFSPHSFQIASTGRELETLRQRLSLIGEQITEIDTRVDRIPRRTEELSILQQKTAVLQETHLEFMRKVKDAELAETLESAQQGPQVTLLDRAWAPSGPVTSPLLILFPGLVAALVLAIVMGFALELLDPVVLSPAHFESLGPAPVVGSVYRLP
ncbi:MAG: hypothetical protein P8M78_03870 [Myxococcota bacterium]|nr:hypothetical protein [Myxococcota bacterium]